MKRLTDTDKWEKFLSGLPMAYKLFWLFITDKCSNAGIWPVNKEIAEAYIGGELDLDKALELFGDRIHVFMDGRKWFIVSFPGFQEKGRLNAKHNRQAGIIEELQKYDLFKLVCLNRSKNEKGVLVYEIADKIIKDTYEDRYEDSYGDTYNDRYSVTVSESVSEREKERETVSEQLNSDCKNQKFQLIQPEREILEKFGFLHDELKQVPAGEIVDDHIWLAGKVIKKYKHRTVRNQPFTDALLHVCNNLKDQNWFHSAGGLYWLLDVKPGPYNGEKALVLIGKYMDAKNQSIQEGNIKEKIQDSVKSYADQFGITS